MKFNLTLVSRTLIGALALSPVLAFAQGVIVPPPMPAGMAPAVAPAQGVSSAVPVAQKKETEIVEVNLSSASSSSPTSVVTPASQLQKPYSLPPVPLPTSTLSSPTSKSFTSSDIDAFEGLVVTPVSDSQLNRFVFPEPLEGLYFSEGAPLPQCSEEAAATDPCRPIFLNGKRVVLLQLRAGATGPVQMLAHLKSGRIITLNLAPGKGQGAIVRIDGAEDGASDTRLAEAYRESQFRSAKQTPAEINVDILSQIARGDIPAGFEPEYVGKTVRFEHFDVIPMSAWNNGSDLRAHLFQIRAHTETPVAIDSSLFRTPNVQALALDRDTITFDSPAMLYMLEHVSEGY